MGKKTWAGPMLFGAAAILILSTIGSLPARAAIQAEEARFVEEILVVGARLPRRAKDVVGKVDVITSDKLIDEMANSLSDVTRYTPGVSVATADSRFGETEITIRGLSGNRVASLIDGVPVPDQFDIGSFANAGQDYLVADAISRVEILRGPASTLFGSDALGGVFAIVTKAPEEYLQGNRSNVGGNVTWSGRDDSTTINGSLALGGGVGNGNLAGVVHLTRKDGHEVNRAAVESPDAQDRTQKSLFSRLGYTLPSGNRVRLDVSLFEEQVATDVISVLGFGRQFRNTTSLTGDDQRNRYATTLGYDFSADRRWIDQGRINAYWQQVKVDQRTTELREPINTLNQRNFSYDTETVGLAMDFESTLSGRRTEHRIGWGLALERGKIREQRDGYSQNLLSGATTHTMLGESMPVRDFPNSTVDEIAVYVHDEIALGQFTLIPGLRYQSYSLNAQPDPIFHGDNQNTTVVDSKESSLAPKLGALWHVNPATQVYAQYAHGFRAPPFEDLNIGLDIPLFNIRAIPNPDLKPETSDGIELGVRYQADSYRVSLAAFGADYDNLIDTKVNLGPDPATGTLIFQSQNVDQARVYGAELEFNASLDRWMTGLSFDAAASITRGRNRTTDQPLNTVDPAELVTALTWQPTDRTRVGLVVTAVAAQERVDDSSADLMTTDGHVVVDLTGSIRISRNIRLDAGLFNAFDETYWQWSSVRNRTVNDPMIDYLSAPGRYASVSLRVEL